MRALLAHYPEVDRPFVAMAKEFAAGTHTGRHSHSRAQLILAIRGLMVAQAESGTWVVPPGYALWMPAGMAHDVAMHGDVSMRTVYVRADVAADVPGGCRVIAATPLLEAALVSLVEEPRLYSATGRGGHLAALILDELAVAPATRFALPVPADPRLARLVRALIDNPGSDRNIDGWAEISGLSRRTLTRLFRHQTGLSFGAWQRRLRLLGSDARLADGEPPAKVAASVGYRSLAAFRAMARREIGDL
jgi:AraC-like DNA-binding protein